MNKRKKNIKVMVAMSGGVDSSVAAYLLKAKGYDCVGATIKTWPKDECEATGGKMCCSLDAVSDARACAAKLGMPHYCFDLSAQFSKTIRKYYLDEYRSGRTPNPCVLCNSEIKFGLLLQKARELGCSHIATGHFARIKADKRTGRFLLMKGVDKSKDQSYFLFNLDQEQLSRVIFPLGNMTKDAVREKAKGSGISVYNKPSSQDICFDVDISNDRPGNIILSDGRVLGRHKGISSYTVGQRKGLGIGYSEPLYVTRIDALNNIVTVGVRADIFKTGLIASGMNWIVEPKFPFNAAAKTRYGQENVACTVSDIGGGRVSVRFSKKMNAPTPGQCVVFYKRDTVLGGGWIDEAFDE